MDASEEEIKEIQKKVTGLQTRIFNTEEVFGNLCAMFGSYTRNLAKCRDKNDKVARELNDLANNERLNVTMKATLTEFVKNYSAVQDHLDIKIKRIRQNVIHPLSFYDSFCKQIKKSSRQNFSALKKELESKHRLSKMQRTRAYQNLLDSKIGHCVANSNKLKKQLGEEMEGFEKRKLSDLKKTLMTLVSAEIDFSMKSLQFFTECYKNLEEMDEDADFKQFQDHLHGAMKFTENHLKTSTTTPLSTLNNSGLGGTMESTDSREIKKSPKKASFDDHDEDSDEDINDSDAIADEESDDDDDDEEYNNFVPAIN